MAEGDVIRDATISPCGTYRYDLIRRWGEGGCVLWVMLNPSTADALVDDPTIRRCIGFTKAWGYNALTVVNLFALRATDPKALKGHRDPGGPKNVEHIDYWVRWADFGVAAWGAFDVGWKKRSGIEATFRLAEKPLYCLGKTKNGSPRHPLYVKGDQPRVPFNPREIAA